jgi:hypothetical protein
MSTWLMPSIGSATHSSCPAIGIRGVVAKRRHLLLWQSVRIHLDEVERLGTFIELEAIAPADSDLAHEHGLVAELRDALGITDGPWKARAWTGASGHTFTMAYMRHRPTDARYGAGTPVANR